ncbi:hypothetical protein [Kineococcus sp. NPDC059986]|jgi:hypothetical protein|uniref:hypothetical protein n=1 Tax=Kineococcus sp. NPDC059986 TaxID=3155538 RepID=UPI00344C0F6B
MSTIDGDLRAERTATTSTSRPALGARLHAHRAALIAALVTVGLGGLGVGATAMAGGFAVTQQDNGVVMNDLSRVANIYDGRVVSLKEIEQLNDEGKAKFTIASPELTCQGVALYVDTAAEADAYDLGYRERSKARAAAGMPSGGAGPCAVYQDAPNFVPPGVELPATSAQQP